MDCSINYIEHIEFVVNIRYTRRGALQIHLESPRGEIVIFFVLYVCLVLWLKCCVKSKNYRGNFELLKQVRSPLSRVYNVYSCKCFTSEIILTILLNLSLFKSCSLFILVLICRHESPTAESTTSRQITSRICKLASDVSGHVGREP